jgi:hypothetical protein
MEDQKTDRASGVTQGTRFGVKSLLAGVAVLAAWFSTFSGYAFSPYVRDFIMFAILCASFFGAMYSRGKRRAFWTGFSLVMFIACTSDSVRANFVYFEVFAAPELIALMVAKPSGAQLSPAAYESIREAYNLSLAAIIGGLAAYIYDRSGSKQINPTT